MDRSEPMDCGLAVEATTDEKRDREREARPMIAAMMESMGRTKQCSEQAVVGRYIPTATK
jgi:hypothetical protein